MQEVGHHLRGRGVPLVLCGSRHSDPLQEMRAQLGTEAPFISATGSALLVPVGYFAFSVGATETSGGYEIVRFGEKPGDLLKVLHRASQETGIAVDVLDTAALTFQPKTHDPTPLLARIERYGRRWTQDGAGYVISSDQDRKLAVMVLTRFFFQISRRVLTIGIGNSVEDLDVLSAVDRPVILRSRSSAEIQRLLPATQVTDLPGSAGFVETIYELIPRPDETQPQVA